MFFWEEGGWGGGFWGVLEWLGGVQGVQGCGFRDWMKPVLDESVVGRNHFWMKMSLDETVFG